MEGDLGGQSAECRVHHRVRVQSAFIRKEHQLHYHAPMCRCTMYVVVVGIGVFWCKVLCGKASVNTV